MKLINFAVNNFRAISGGLENNQINFEGSNTIFIFGQNNVGKSTFLAAYQFLVSNDTPTIDDFYKRGIGINLEFEVQLGVDDIDLKHIEDKQPKKFDSFKKYLNDKSQIKIRRTFTSATEKGKPKVDKPKDITWDPTTQTWTDSSFGSIGLISVFQELMPTPILIKAMPTEAEVEKVVNEILVAKAKSKLDESEFDELIAAQQTVKDLQDKMYNPASIEAYETEVNLHFQQLFPDTKIDLEDSDKVKWTEDKFGKKFSVSFTKLHSDGSNDEETPSSYTSIGHGAVRSAIFSLLLMRDVAEELERHNDRKEYLILFEEPELFLYPKLLKTLRELIYAVSQNNFPYQVLCASHSPQMIDLSKRNSTLIRMLKTESGTKLFQVKDDDLKAAKGSQTMEDLKQAMYEVLRFNPYICESFYADEVLLVEGSTEEIIIRGILQKVKNKKDLFIVNCGSVTNIPFYQKIYRKFAIKSHVICDSDTQVLGSPDEFGNPSFGAGIQFSIYNEHLTNCKNSPRVGGILRVHTTTFEVAHKDELVNDSVKYPDTYETRHGKPFNANRYWQEVLEPKFADDNIDSVPLVRYVKEILGFTWNP